MPTVNDDLVEEYRRAFKDVFAGGTREERRQLALLSVKKIEVDPGTGDILMHLFGRPPGLVPKQTPASGETGVRIGLVAGACFEAIHDVVGDVLWRTWELQRNGRRPAASSDRA